MYTKAGAVWVVVHTREKHLARVQNNVQYEFQLLYTVVRRIVESTGC